MLLFVSCTTHYEEIDDITDSQPDLNSIPLTKSGITDEISFKVDYQLLLKYLKFNRKNLQTLNISPLTIDNDTLAYYINDGSNWEIVSGDKRLPPVMIKSDGGVFNLYDSDIQGLLHYIKTISNSSEGEIMNTWEFLDTPLIKPNAKISQRGGGNWSSETFTIGMWRAIDTLLVDEVNQTPHIITTHWNQKQPWREYTPYIGSSQAPVGCGAVAVGQILYHYRKDNHLNVEFPLYAIALNDSTSFNEDFMDATRWYSMALTEHDENTESVALMLAYLGTKKLHQIYHSNSTEITHERIDSSFNWGKLNFTKRSGYDYYIVKNSLDANIPVCLFSPTTGGGNTHVYIIDRYLESRTYYSITYEWDPNYKVSEEEYYSNDPRLFIESASSDELVLEFDILTNTYFGMNWGYNDTSFDNRFYLEVV